MLENYAEYLVREVLNENRGTYEAYKLQMPEDDIIGMILNKIPPKYFLSTSSEGEKKAYLVNRQMRLEALIKLTEVMEQFSKKM